MFDLGSQTERTLRDVVKLPDDTQRKMAIKVLETIINSIIEIEKTPGPSSPERDEVMRRQLTNRYRAHYPAGRFHE